MARCDAGSWRLDGHAALHLVADLVADLVAVVVHCKRRRLRQAVLTASFLEALG
jgi:hypothetical protein